MIEAINKYLICSPVHLDLENDLILSMYIIFFKNSKFLQVVIWFYKSLEKFGLNYLSYYFSTCVFHLKVKVQNQAKFF